MSKFNTNEKFDIVEFYRRMSIILESYREKGKSYSVAISEINSLNDLAKSYKIDVFVDASILESISNFDDERSYVDEDYSYEDSYSS